MKHYLVKDHFYGGAAKLRQVFEDRFQDPRKTQSERFAWDYWYVKDQYRMIRTPAYLYFPRQVYQDFHSSLVQWGRENLGCHDISPSWLSYYVEGCRQNLHADVPHGPWAFVYSLSPKRRKFTGGETLILRPGVLNYWKGFSDKADREYESFVERVASPFNRLTVFDPRFPHGVTEVRGVEDPLEARLVIHGWFVEPRPYVVGPLTTKQVANVMEQVLFSLEEAMPHLGNLHGTVSVRLRVGPDGTLRDLHLPTNTLVGLEDNQRQRRLASKFLLEAFTTLKFPAAKGESKLTIPLMFK